MRREKRRVRNREGEREREERQKRTRKNQPAAKTKTEQKKQPGKKRALTLPNSLPLGALPISLRTQGFGSAHSPLPCNKAAARSLHSSRFLALVLLLSSNTPPSLFSHSSPSSHPLAQHTSLKLLPFHNHQSPCTVGERGKRRHRRESGHLPALDDVGDVVGHLEDLGVIEGLDLAHGSDVVLGDEVDAGALAAKPPGAADAVDVVLQVGW